MEIRFKKIGNGWLVWFEGMMVDSSVSNKAHSRGATKEHPHFEKTLDEAMEYVKSTLGK